MLDQANYVHIEIARKDNGVVLATLNHPKRLNTVNRQMHWEIGLGVNYALVCDIVVSSHKAVFADIHVRRRVGAGMVDRSSV